MDGEDNMITSSPSGGVVGGKDEFFNHTGRGFNSSVVGITILSCWIILSNLLLIVAIVTSDRRRQASFNLHALNLSIAGLVMGGLVLPLLTDFEVKGDWPHNNTVCRLWLVSDMVVCSVSVMIVGMMIFDRFVLFSCSSIKHGGCRFVFSAFVFLTPWVLACCFVVPVYQHGETGKGVDADRGVCYLRLDSTYSVLFVVGGYFVPGLAAFGLLVAMSLTWFIHRAKLREMVQWSSEMESSGWQVLVSWLQCLAVIGMWLPFSILYLVLYLSESDWPLNWLEAAVWISYAHAGVSPLIWLVMPSILQSVTRLFKCCCCCRAQDRDEETRKHKRRQHPVSKEHSGPDDAQVAMLDFRYKTKL